VSVAKARVRVLPHRVDKQVEGVARQGGHTTLMCTIVILINENLWKSCQCGSVSINHSVRASSTLARQACIPHQV
jgi:hypothetical protein